MRKRQASLLIAAVVGLLSLALALVTAEPGVSFRPLGADHARPEAVGRVARPFTVAARAAAAAEPNAGRIHGQVVANGTAVPNVTVSLYRYLANSDMTAQVLEATTTITGYYQFENPPTPPANWTYYVVYGPNVEDPRYVLKWEGPDVPNYTAGQVASGGTLNIANVGLVEPADGARVILPTTFRWEPRPSTTDSYRWRLYDPATGAGWQSTPLGYVDALTLTPELVASLPGFEFGKTYQWELRIDDVSAGSASYGLSFEFNTVTFVRDYRLFLPNLMRRVATR